MSGQITLIFHYFEKTFYLTTDASNIAIGGVIRQKDEYDNLRPLTFFSRKLNKAEINYSTIEKEVLAIALWSKNKQNIMARISNNGSH